MEGKDNENIKDINPRIREVEVCDPNIEQEVANIEADFGSFYARCQEILNNKQYSELVIERTQKQLEEAILVKDEAVRKMNELAVE